MKRNENSNKLKSPSGLEYVKGRFYPNIPFHETDEYIITSDGDRLDSIAYSYYRDSSLYWVIGMCNNNITKGLMCPIPGTQLRIVTDLNRIITLYNQFNQAR